MWAIIVKYFKQYLTPIIGVGVLALGIWYHDWRVTYLEEELANEKQVVAIVTNEYERAIVLAQHNADALDTYKENQKVVVAVLKTKHAEDIKTLQDINKILERTRHVSDEDDGNVSNVINSTLDSLRLLREER